MNEAQLNTEIEHLKQKRDWIALCELYHQASKESSTLERRLFFDWERATLLATELQDGHSAILALIDATNAGGPLSVIAPQIEAIRANHLSDLKLQDLARSIYENWMREHRDEAIYSELVTWFRQIPAKVEQLPQTSTPNQLSSISSKREPAHLSSGLIKQSTSPTLALTSQSTVPEQQDPRTLLWAQLTVPNSTHQSLTWINQLKELINLKPLNADEQQMLEPLLWQAAHHGQQWLLWVQLYEQNFLCAPGETTPLTERLFQLASVIEVNLKDIAKASELYQRVLTQDHVHDEAFDRLHELLRNQKRWEDFCQILINFAKNSTHTRDEFDRFDLYVEAGDCYAQQLNNQAKAISSWFSALELNPESKQVFVRLLEIYMKAQKWNASIKVLRKLSELEDDVTKSAFHLYRIGELQRDQLKDEYLAVRSFDEALDRDPHFIKAFQAIDDMLGTEMHDLNITERRDRYYRKMLARAVEHQLDPSLITELGVRVGELNAGPLAQWEEAQRAYELALEYDSLRDEAHLGLVEVCAHLEGPQAGAERAFTWIRRVPSQPLAYLALFERSMQAQHWDHAFCAALALEALKHPHPEVKRHLESGKDLLGARLSRPLTTHEWRLLEWAQFEWGGEGDEWGEIMVQLSPLLISRLKNSEYDLQLNPKNDLITLDDSTLIGRVASYICSCLNFTPPKIWLCHPPQGKLITPICVQGEMGLGLSKDVMNRLAIEELACALALGLAITQPNSWAVAIEEHHQTLEALSYILTDQAFPPDLQAYGEALRTELSHDTEGAHKATTLRQLAQRGSPLKTWRVAIEQTSYRAALLICGDIRLLQLLTQSMGLLSDDPKDERFYKLLLFSVSPHYLTLRKQLQVGWL